MEKDWFVYMVQTRCGCLYTGISTNVIKRFRQHCDVHAGVIGARGAKYFRARCPQDIVFCERAVNRSSATVREREIKKLSRTKKMQLSKSGFLDILSSE